MIEGVEALVLSLQGYFWVTVLVVLRLGAMLFVLPVFGERSVPRRVKLGLLVAFAMIVAPAVAPQVGPAPEALVSQVFAGGAEVVTGLFFGLTLRLFIFALQVAGTIAAQSTSLSQIFGASAGVDPMPAIGNTLVVGGLALAALLDLHVRLAEFMILGFQLVEPGQWPSPATVAEAGVAEVSRCFALAFTLAAPFVVASLIYNITLGVINRAMPQLMVAFVGAPAITAGGLALMALSAALLLDIWQTAFFDFLASPFGPRP